MINNDLLWLSNMLGVQLSVRVAPEDGILGHVSVTPNLISLVIKLSSVSYLVILLSEEYGDLDLKKVRATEIKYWLEIRSCLD